MDARRRKAVRSGATATVRRSAALDAAPWPDAARPDAVAAKPNGMPERQAAPLPEVVKGGPSREAPGGPSREALGGPSREVLGEPSREVLGEPSRAVRQVGPLANVARPLCDPGHSRRRSPRSWRH
jgi:hypothetical protein